jgi:hypothetical protein
MLFLRFFLFVISSAFVLSAVLLVAYDIFLIFELGRWLKPKEPAAAKPEGEQGRFCTRRHPDRAAN